MDPLYRDSLCRFCLSSSDNLVDLFEENGQHGFIIEETVEDLLRLKISKVDGFPPFVCPMCLGKLDNFRLFKRQCNTARVEYAHQYFRKGTSDVHSISSGYRCIKQDPDECMTEDFVPCEVSIKTEQEDGEVLSGATLSSFNDARDVTSDDNYSEGEECGLEVGEMQIEPDIPSDPSYYDDRTSIDAVEVRSEEGGGVPQQKRKSWDKISMIRAVEAVANKEMSLLRASKAFNVPRSTIKDYVKRNGKNSVDASIGRRPVLPSHLEAQLVGHCLELERGYFGLTPRDVERTAYRLATRNGLKHPFSDERKAAGRKWVRQFFRRHPELTYRKPQTPAAARTSGFTRRNVQRFFQALEPELEKIDFSPERVYSVDETSFAITGRGTAVCIKGRAHADTLSGTERDTLITLVSCANAAGTFLPPLMVWDGRGEQPPLSTGTCGPLGAEAFMSWMGHFVSHAKPGPFSPAVLVLDAHHSHNRNIDVSEFARQHRVSLVCLPPHSSHKMNPLEVSFLEPLRSAYSRELENWRGAENRGELPSLLEKAYGEASGVEVAAEGFWKTGISPFQRNAFGDHDFATDSRASLECEAGGDAGAGGGVTTRAATDGFQRGASRGGGSVPEVKGRHTQQQQAGTSGRRCPVAMTMPSPYA